MQFYNFTAALDDEIHPQQIPCNADSNRLSLIVNKFIVRHKNSVAEDIIEQVFHADFPSEFDLSVAVVSRHYFKPSNSILYSCKLRFLVSSMSSLDRIGVTWF